MIQGLAALLLFQSLGEAIAQLTGAPVPGPVIGLLALLAVLVVRQHRGRPVWAALAQAADGLLAHLSIFFIPAAVGVMLYWQPLAREGLAWIVALVASTVVSIAVVAWFLRDRLGGSFDEGTARAGEAAADAALTGGIQCAPNPASGLGGTPTPLPRNTGRGASAAPGTSEAPGASGEAGTAGAAGTPPAPGTSGATDAAAAPGGSEAPR